MLYKDALSKAQEYDKNLRAGDERFNQAVHIIHREGTTCFFEHAFTVQDGEYLFIFTEHHGFSVYSRDDVVVHQYVRIAIEEVRWS